MSFSLYCPLTYLLLHVEVMRICYLKCKRRFQIMNCHFYVFNFKKILFSFKFLYVVC